MLRYDLPHEDVGVRLVFRVSNTESILDTYVNLALPPCMHHALLPVNRYPSTCFVGEKPVSGQIKITSGMPCEL